MKTIKIVIKTYDLETPELQAEFKKLGLQPSDSLHFQFHNIPAGIYHVETKHIFNNQYNTTEGYRIFEKCSCLSSHLKRLNGYYIAEGIDAIRAYQKRVKTCRYCGKQYVDSDQQWCDKCRGSKYLKPEDYHLLKLMNVMDKPASADTTIPADVLADIKQQQQKTKERLVKERFARAIESLNQKIADAKKEKEFLYLCVRLDVPIDNVIYYGHTGTFCFGWNTPLTETQKKEIRRKLKNAYTQYKIEFK